MRAPSFVIAGQPNEGKTTVAATLIENDKAKRASLPRTTRKLLEYPVTVDNQVRFRIYDTPGFENPGELLEWFRTHSSRHENPAKAFLAVQSHKSDYPYDCEILKPIADGAAIIHVVNPARPVDDVDRFEAEIFRLCGRPRIGLMNIRGGETQHHGDWVNLMTKEVNTYLEFDACEAVFGDRVRLLESIAKVLPGWSSDLDNAIAALSEDWDNRLVRSAELIVNSLRDLIKYRKEVPYDDGENSIKEARENAERHVKEHIREWEKEFRNDIREIFKHNMEHWRPEPDLDLDLFSEETWQIFGFSKRSIIIGAALAGAATGTVIDITTGGGTVGIGTLIGGAVGGIAAYLYLDKAIKIEIPGVRLGPFRFRGLKLGGQSVRSGIERRSKLPSILLDRMICYAASAARRSHGKLAAPNANHPDRAWAITQSLEESGEAVKVLALIELWHRDKDRVLTAKELEKLPDSERLLLERLADRMREATGGLERAGLSRQYFRV